MKKMLAVVGMCLLSLTLLAPPVFADYAAQATLAADAAFQARVRIAAIEYSFVVMAEVDGPFSPLRRQFAYSVLQDGGITKLPSIVYAVVSNNTITSQSSDLALIGVIQSFWNGLSGVGVFVGVH
jgi:hypothetical protein